jgi:cellulose synthase/poly-beta-1,6-N-acetylglucosamine synthase-like glycosyltransferase
LAICLPIGLLALVFSALSLYAAILFLRHLHLPKVHRSGLVTLILPLTGKAPGLKELLGALDAQSLAPRRLIICVESTEDPAYRCATALSDGVSFPIEIVLAGAARRCAQKCTNQIAGLQRIDARDEAVVFLDADILPPRWWLSALVSPLLDGSADVVSGYRWPIITTVVPATLLGAQMVASIDRAVALLPRLSGFDIVWGGSLAFSAQAMSKLQLGLTLATTLSDDCTLGEYAAARDLRVLTRRALLVPTPVISGLVCGWRFARRQYQIIRLYRPRLWWLAATVLTVRLGAWACLFTHLDFFWARPALIALIMMSLAGFVLHLLVAQRLGFTDRVGVRFGQGLLALLKPLVDLFHWTAILAAFAFRTIRWGHIVYRITGPNNITIRSRIPWA